MEDLKRMIDATTFGTVRRYLRVAHSPITTVLLVRHRSALPRVGSALLSVEGESSFLGRPQWAEWFASGEVRVGDGPADGVHQVADLNSIPDSTICDVLFLPPVYLVCLRGYHPREAPCSPR